MLIKVNRIQVNNCEIIADDLNDLAELKKDLAEKLNVNESDIMFNYTEFQE